MLNKNVFGGERKTKRKKKKKKKKKKEEEKRNKERKSVFLTSDALALTVADVPVGATLGLPGDGRPLRK